MLSTLVSAISLCAVFTLIADAQAQRSPSENCSSLYLLNVQPFPDGEPFGGFDRGLDLIPAARLAAEEINNRTDILAGFDLKLIDIDSEACARVTITNGLVNFYRELLDRQCFVGVMGFVCSSVTNLLAPIIGHENIGYITLANSVSPEHRDVTRFPNLFHTLSSSSVHNKALISLMETFGWNRIGVVFESESVFFMSTAKDFEQRIQSMPEMELTVSVPITTAGQHAEETFTIINSEEARITYWVTINEQTAFGLCEAYQRQFISPGYVYILRYSSTLVKQLLQLAENTVCSTEEMIQAMEGIFALDYRPFVDDDTELFSGSSYGEFRQRYSEKLEEFGMTNGQNLRENIFANSFYDQVWAFALALNNSIPSIYAKNLTFSSYTIGNTDEISSVIKQELMKLSFQGASGRIEFSDRQEIPSFVDIFQIRNGTAEHIAIFNQFSKKIEKNDNFPEPDDVPPDTFDTFYSLLLFQVGILIFVIQGLLFCLITVNVALLFWWRKEREVKATSFTLSLLLSVGCYLLCIGPVIRTAYRVTIVRSTTIHNLMCSLNLWSTSLGLDLILATLLLRLFRVVHVFRSFQRHSKYLSDWYLLAYALLICSLKVLFLVIWSGVDLYSSLVVRQYDPTVAPPKYRVLVSCSCNNIGIWLTVSYVYSVVLLMIVMFLAIQTRKIKKSYFKDTKKVNFFVFLVIITFSTTIALMVIFTEIGIEIGADISEWAGVCIIATACQLCLLIPKLLPIAVKKDKQRRGITLGREYTLASEFEWIRRKSRHSLSQIMF